MAGVNQGAIETFISIAGVPEDVAARKLQEHGGDLNAAVNAYFNEGDRSALVTVPEASVAVPQDDLMDIDEPLRLAPPRRNTFFPLSETAAMDPFEVIDSLRRGVFDGGSSFMNPRAPFVSQPRERREIPIEVKDGGDGSRSSPLSPVIEDVTGTEQAQGSFNHGPIIVEDEDDDDTRADLTTRAAQQNERTAGVLGDSFREGYVEGYVRPSAPVIDDMPGYGNDIEEEMVRAAIEASKRDAQESSDFGPQQRQFHSEDTEVEHAMSLSLKTAERERALLEQMGSEAAGKPADVDARKAVASNGRMEAGTSSIQDEPEEEEDLPLIRHRSRRMSSGSPESAKEVGVVEVSPPSSPGQNDMGNHPLRNGNAFPSEEWGGISSEEHDEAVMLEAAMFGGIPEVPAYRMPYAPHQFMQSEERFPQQMPRPPSPTLQAQRLIREQQDDEYLAALAADREKEMKAMEEAEARRLQEEAARLAALEEEKQKQEESRRKLEQEQEFERQLAAKEASLPQEPSSDDENAVTLLVRMPDGSRRGRRFLKSDNLQALFDFIDIGRVFKPGTYRVVRPYPRRAFSDGESTLTFSELGLASKQEALFLELI